MKKQDIGTTLVHSGTDPKKFGGVVNPPPHRASTIVFETYDDFIKKLPSPYGRIATPSSVAFEKAISELEGAFGSVATCSGLSAITTSLMAFLKAGDHALIIDNCYAPTRVFATDMLKSFGVEVDFFAPKQDKDIEEMFKSNTRVLFFESPGSLTFEICDVEALVSAAKKRNIVTIMDNSWSTPVLFKPLEMGIDVSLMSATKYICGHSDAILGVISGTGKTYPILKQTAIKLGNCAGSEELYLGLRGLHTLEVRMREHEAKAIELAEWLQTLPEIKEVMHPALPSSYGHDIWKKYYKGSNGTFGTILHETDEARIAAMLNHLKLFRMGASWGGHESLCFPTQPIRICKGDAAKEGFYLRFHVGFENIEDLKQDILSAFELL